MDIQEYISHFSVLSSQAGLPNNIALQGYFSWGLLPSIATEALRQRPTTISDWKEAARKAWEIRQLREQFIPERYNHARKFKKSKSRYRPGFRKPNPRYANIYEQPVRQREHSEWDMDVDALYYSLNELDLDRDDNEAEEFEGANSNSKEEDYKDNQLNEIRQANPDRRMLQNFINHVLNQDQRSALRRGDCFWCKKSGHWWIDCKARKLYNQQAALGNFSKINKYKSKPKFSKGPKKPKPFKKAKQPFVKKQPVDPNAMVYNLEEEDDELEEFTEYMNNRNF
jgi:hypothetical protein